MGGELRIVYSQAGGEVPGTGSEYAAAKRGNVSFMRAPHDDLYSVDFDTLWYEADDIEDVLVSPMQRIIEWKQAVGRDKDLADLALILSASST